MKLAQMNMFLRRRVPATQAELLEIVNAVANNRKHIAAPPDILMAVVGHRNADAAVLAAVAGHPNADAATLNTIVRVGPAHDMAIATHPHTAAADLDTIAARTPGAYAAIVGNAQFAGVNAATLNTIVTAGPAHDMAIAAHANTASAALDTIAGRALAAAMPGGADPLAQLKAVQDIQSNTQKNMLFTPGYKAAVDKVAQTLMPAAKTITAAKKNLNKR